MADFTVLNPKWNDDKIKDAFGICDEALANEDRFYYITSEGKLAYLETKATNKASAIAKVFYTLGLLDSDRTAKEQISCGIICNKKHLQEVCTDGCYGNDEMKAEAIKVLAQDIKELVDEINNKFEAMANLMD
jgi:hypothetical protein